MNEILWDGQMDVSWIDLSNMIKDNATRFTDYLSKAVSLSFNKESQSLITEDSLERFLNIANRLAENITDGFFNCIEDLDKNSNNASKLNAWILLGSLTESALQIFLAFYINDYKNAKWQLWENINSEIIKSSIVDTINDLVINDHLSNEQAKSIKEAVKNKIKEHTKEHPIQKIMLDELIKFYESIELFSEDEIDYLKCIQSNRNGIHSFQSRNMGTWNDLQYSVRFFCYLQEWIISHLPDIDF